jgi:DNA polymerase III subunit epsilon
MRRIILDTETTGLSPKQGHRIIEVGCIEMVGRKLTGNHFHRYINPERVVEQGAIDVHGITNEFLTDKPVFKMIADELFDYLDGAELVIHNAPFDMGFLNHEFKLLGHKAQKLEQFCTVIDSLVMARKKHPGQPNSLDALCRRYYVDSSKRELHGALLDAQILADVYLAMTGGQVTMFSQGEAVDAAATIDAGAQKVARTGALKVIYANAAELAAHEAFN